MLGVWVEGTRNESHLGSQESELSTKLQGDCWTVLWARFIALWLR